MDELAIKIEHVSKQYRLGAIGGGTLKGDLQTWWARKRGKEDPNSKIGARTDIKIGERFLALDDINLEVKKGEALGIIGHNGAGKSTLLKLLSRVTAPTTGTISYNGRITSMLEVGTGFHPELTGRENIYMNGAILGLSKKEIDAKMEQIIDFSEVRQFIDTPVKRYSSGMYVKLAFSVAAHLDSEIMIMDEVLAVGDMAYQRKCIEKMRSAAKDENRTVLYVSHNMSTIRRLCDRCIVLDHGCIAFDGSVDEAVELYLGKGNTNEQIRYFTDADHEQWCRKKMTVQSVRVVNDIATIYPNDKLQFEIRFSAIEKIQGIKSRLVLLDNQSTIIGMAISSNAFDAAQGSSGVLRVSFDTASLSAGTYSMRASFFDIDEFGNHEYICVLNRFIDFVINDRPELNAGMNWAVSSWGHISFPSYRMELEQ